MATILELAASIVESHASTTSMTTDELIDEIEKVFASLKRLESGETAIEEVTTKQPGISAKQSIKQNEVICMVCGKGGMKTLARHLSQSHGMSRSQYRKEFGIPATQSLTAKKFSESRRQMAKERGLGENLAKARAVRAQKIAQAKAPAEMPATPAAKSTRASSTRPAKKPTDKK